MANSSPLRRSQLLSSPDRPYLSSFLLDDRNNELSHRDALAAAQVEHQRVRDAAIRVYELHELKEEHNRILEQERREQERLKAEAAIAAEETRLQELRAKSIPKPTPPRPEPEPVKPVEKPVEEKKPEPAAPRSPELKKSESPAQLQLKSQPPAPAPQQNGLFSNVGRPPASNPFATASQQSRPQQPSPFSQNKTPTPAVTTPQPQQPAVQRQAPQPPKSSVDPLSDRYVQIHQALKQLRKDLVAASKAAGSPLKGRIGTIRREIRVSIGQLTGGKGANAQPVSDEQLDRTKNYN